jgi:hypothetical protein
MGSAVEEQKQMGIERVMDGNESEYRGAKSGRGGGGQEARIADGKTRR